MRPCQVCSGVFSVDFLKGKIQRLVIFLVCIDSRALTEPMCFCTTRPQGSLSARESNATYDVCHYSFWALWSSIPSRLPLLFYHLCSVHPCRHGAPSVVPPCFSYSCIRAFKRRDPNVSPKSLPTAAVFATRRGFLLCFESHRRAKSRANKSFGGTVRWCVEETNSNSESPGNGLPVLFGRLYWWLFWYAEVGKFHA